MNKIIFLLLLFCLQNHYGQKAILKANGELIKLNDKHTNEAIIGSKIKSGSGEFINNILMDAKITNPQGILDTLQYNDQAVFNTNFGFFDQNVMLQYFVAPTDMIIKAAGFSTSDDAGSENATVSLRILKLNWTYEQLINVPAPLNIGVYPEDGDGLGGTDPFGESATGNWTDLSGGLYPLPPWSDNADPAANSYNYDLWSEFLWWPITAVASPLDAKVYQWIIMSDFGFEPEVAKGEVFAVALTHDGTDPAFTDRIGFWADNSIGIPAWKYYEEGRLDAGDGWWVRQYTWDFVVAVDLLGDIPPEIRLINYLRTTISTDPQRVVAEVIDRNPSGGEAGVKNVNLVFVTNYSDTHKVVMEYLGNNKYGGDISIDEGSGEEHCSSVEYWVEATDVNDNSSESRHIKYSIFCITDTDYLVIFNGGTEEKAKELAPLYIQNSIPNYDLWAFGPIPQELLEHYKTVIEIGGIPGPSDNNWSMYRDFLENGNRTMAVIGQEALGHLFRYDTLLTQGDHEYDILGVKKDYLDVNYSSENISWKKSSVTFAIEDTKYSDSLYQWIIFNEIDTLKYDPYKTIKMYNWMDQFEPRDDINSNVFLTSLANDGNIRPVGHTFTDDKNNKIFFMSVDPLGLTTDSVWVGNSELSPLVQFLREIVVSVDANKEDKIPTEIQLCQNYPNPFNPTTTIEYSIPRDVKRETANVKGTFIPSGVEGGKVKLIVYDVLGRAVKTLVNKVHAVGNYTVQFNGNNLNSGVYFYQLTAGEFIQTRKMLLLK